MRLLREIIPKLHGKRLSGYFDKAASEPNLTQRELLGRILERNNDTEFARRHYFHKISSENSYRQHVVIQDQESVKPYISRMMAGEKKLLTRDDPVMFTSGNGTKGEPIYIPVTEELKNVRTDMANLFIYKALTDYPQLLQHKTLSIQSLQIQGKQKAAYPSGIYRRRYITGSPGCSGSTRLSHPG